MEGMINMYNMNQGYPCPNFANAPNNSPYGMYPCTYLLNNPTYNPYLNSTHYNNPYFNNTYFDNQLSNWPPVSADTTQNYIAIDLKDYGPEPFVVDIKKAAIQNDNFRTALWTGKYLQVTLMSIKVGEDIGLEIHPDLDQFILIEEGQGLVKMGDSKDKLDFQKSIYSDYSFIIPAGKWHNLINTGNRPIKLFSIYAPPQHPKGTIHKTKEDALAAENHNH